MQSRCFFRLFPQCLSLAMIVSLAAVAGPRLPGFFGDRMVLQRDKPVPVWGWADAGEKVAVSFAGQTLEATADADGNWRVSLAPEKVSADGRELTVASLTDPARVVTFKDVVVGDVWLCSGQSNMEWTVGRCGIPADQLKTADFPLIRHVKISRNAVDSAQRDVQANWVPCSPAAVSDFTAVGYFFAAKLHRELGVPIGLIGSNWGGTRIEPWTPPEGFRMVPELRDIADKVDAAMPDSPAGKLAHEKALVEIEKWVAATRLALEQGKDIAPMPELPSTGKSHQDCTRIYNGMIHPLIPFAIRGAIWYQGESNGGEGKSYFHKKQALIGGWRKLWDQGDFPFYFVQLANFKTSPDDPAGGDGWAGLRQAQLEALRIPHTGMAVTIDIGEAGNIHPKNKQDVGLRLALWALANEYGQQDLVHSGPLYKKMTVEGGKIRLHFDHTGSGLMVGKKTGLAPAEEVDGGELKRFAVAGADKQWHWAKAFIDGETVLVSSDQVPEPVAVRYAYAQNPAGCNLYNKEGLPASPFRTDDW